MQADLFSYTTTPHNQPTTQKKKQNKESRKIEYTNTHTMRHICVYLNTFARIEAEGVQEEGQLATEKDLQTCE